MAALLRLTGITKRFGALVANDGISLSLARGEVLALLGENGAGKTTLMNILFGHYVADQGTVEVAGEALPPGSPEAAIAAGIGMVHQHFTLADNLSVLDNVTLGTEPLWALRQQRRASRRRLQALAEQFGLSVHPDARVGDLSVGERQRVELLKALYRDARILILDEPTAVLTPQEIDRLFETLRRLVARGLAVTFISHKLGEILRISDRVAVLRRGKVVATMATRDADRAGLAELMVGRAVHRPKATPMAPGAPVLELAGVTVSGAGRTLLDRVDLEVRARQIVAVSGVAGNGQQPLAELLSGLQQPAGGSVKLFGRLLRRFSPRALIRAGVARIPEDRHAAGVVGEMTVWENLVSEQLRRSPLSRSHTLIDGRACRAYARRLIEAFDVRCPGPDAETRLLSGGNIQKLILARALAREPRLIVASQPSRGLDEGAIAYVHQQLLAARERGAGVVLLSEDLDEVLALADRIVVIYQGRLSAPYQPGMVDARRLGLLMSGHDAAIEDVA